MWYELNLIKLYLYDVWTFIYKYKHNKISMYIFIYLRHVELRSSWGLKDEISNNVNKSENNATSNKSIKLKTVYDNAVIQIITAFNNFWKNAVFSKR